jgi:hypothetical protein
MQKTLLAGYGHPIIKAFLPMEWGKNDGKAAQVREKNSGAENRRGK